MSRRKKKPIEPVAPQATLSHNARIVQPSYLEKAANNQKELIRRLSQLTTVLQEDETVEPNDTVEWPGLAAVAQTCAELLRHKDKQVRLYSTLICMELFAIYAPECPWDPATICQIFSYTIQQVANLAHCTSPSATDFALYARILEMLAEVKIGVVLVELAMDSKDEVPLARDHSNPTDDIDSFSGYSSASDKKNSRNRSHGHSQFQNLGPETDVEAPLPLLVQFFHTLLHSVRREHAHSLQHQFVKAMAACLEEYSPSGVTVPIPLLDEILLAIASGPTTLIIDAQAKVKKGQPLPQKPVENATYNVAAKLVQVAASRLVTPTASLLSGLLQSDTYTVSVSHISADPEQAWSGADVWSVVRYLYRTNSAILTSVWGTVRDCRVSPDTPQRLAAVQLVGHIFTSRPSEVMDSFGLFGIWLQRQNDVQSDIRQALLPTCLALAGHWAQQSPEALSTLPAQALEDATRTVEALIVSDNSPAVRLKAIHTVCEILYRPSSNQWNPSIVARFLKAVGKRVSARSMNERQDALTGLVKLYEKNHLRGILQPVVDDETAEVARQVIQPFVPQSLRGRRHGRGDRSRSTDRSISPIRRNLWGNIDNGEDEDDADSENGGTETYRWIPRALFCSVSFTDMRHRVVQLVDEGILPKSTVGRPTARSVGLTLVLDALRDGDENLLTDLTTQASSSMRYLLQLLATKATLQQHLEAYLEKRQEWRSLEKGTEASMACEAQALDLLRNVARLSDGPTDDADVKALHRAKDKHIFRLLSNLATPLQVSTERVAQELPRRCQSLPKSVPIWMTHLVRRCGMGGLLNSEIVQASVDLAQACLEQGDVPSCAAFLIPVKVASHIFPALCGQPGTFSILRQLFSQCRGTKESALKKQVEEWRLVTALSCIVSDAASHRKVDPEHEDDDELVFNEDKTEAEAFLKDLMRLCTGEGTPTQAKHAVYTLSRLEHTDVTSFGSPLMDYMTRLVEKIASPLRHTASDEKQITLLSALSALADCAPVALTSQDRGKKALIYALEDILMGRRGNGEENHSSGDEKEPRKTTRGKSPRNQRHKTPRAQNVLEDLSLSTPCRRICAAITFLVSHVRSTFLQKNSNSQASLESTADEGLSYIQITQLFKLLTQILRGKGLPPNDRDRKRCDSRQERAALRQVASINLLRLCDTRLGLEKICFSTEMWHTLGESFLDEENIVRECVMEEFTHLLKGTGVYGMERSNKQAAAPSLRLVAYICLCIDADNSHSSSVANACAAILGNPIVGVHAAASSCVTNLRTLCDAMYNTCRANGAESHFDAVHKMRYMPEYMVPYALHLLALRRETPSGIAIVPPSSEDDSAKTLGGLDVGEDAKDKILARRLKALFDPIIDTLGEGADNISFLLLMTEVLGKHLAPVPPFGTNSGKDSRHVAELQSKLGQILKAARKTLLGHVKKDINLDQYPGMVQIPGSLFQKWTSQTGFVAKLPKRCSDSAPPSILSPKRRRVETPGKSPQRVHFSPDLNAAGAAAPTSTAKQTKKKSFGGISPIASSVHTPMSMRETQTLGSTPPSGPGLTIPSTQHDGGTEIDGISEASSKEIARPSVRQHRQTQRALKLTQSSDLSDHDALLSMGGDTRNTHNTTTGDSISFNSSQTSVSSTRQSRRSRSSQRKSSTGSVSSGSLADDSLGETSTLDSGRSSRRRVDGSSSKASDSLVAQQQENVSNHASQVSAAGHKRRARAKHSTRSLRARK